ncbi:14652_t:CDS:1, partial [Acaulospora colombiana]
ISENTDAITRILQIIEFHYVLLVALGNDRDEVNLGVQSAHEFNIDLLQGMTGGLKEIDAGVDAVIHNFLAVHPVLLLQVGIEAGFDIVENWLPAIFE